MPIISLDLMVAVSFLLIWGLVADIKLADIKLCKRRNRASLNDESLMD